MTLSWTKLGLVFDPREHTDWVCTHAWMPTPDVLPDGRIRVYFAGRNEQNLSQVGAFTIDPRDPHRILDVSPAPLLTLGPLGSFDDSAVIPAWITTDGNEKTLYYVGWMQGRRVPFYAAIGRAVSRDGGRTFTKCSAAPLLPRNDVDPYFTAACCVLRDDGLFRMWYTSNTEWRQIDGEALPRYLIKYAESDDGETWRRDGTVAIPFMNDDEFAISRPWVVRHAGGYRMWYAYRGAAYRIGYAESPDGIVWTRRDDRAGIAPSAAGFDNEMIEYAAIAEARRQLFMFYNGNTFGREGIGLAVAPSDAAL